MKKLFIICILLLFCSNTFAADLVFEGHSYKKIEIAENIVTTHEIEKSKSPEYKVIIQQENGNYYWNTRNNIQLIKKESGVYITFIAINGAGYIRVLNETMRDVYKLLPEEERQKSYLYMEHLIHQLGSITYYGR